MKKIKLIIPITIILAVITIISLYPLIKKQEKVFIIGNNKYCIEHNKSWKEFSDSDTKNPSSYLTSFKFSDEKTVINFYRADNEEAKRWLEYVVSIEQEVDQHMIAYKHGNAIIGQYNADVWFVADRECCEESLETMIMLNDAEGFIFAQMIANDESSNNKDFQNLSKKFYEIIESIHPQ
jgi:uncharacterized protein YxeA